MIGQPINASKIKLMIAELQDMQISYSIDSAMWKWIHDSIFSLDGAACAIATVEEKAHA